MHRLRFLVFLVVVADWVNGDHTLDQLIVTFLILNQSYVHVIKIESCKYYFADIT